MLGKTHLYYGLSASAAVAIGVLHPLSLRPLAEMVAAGLVGGLLPDLDEPGSTISNAPRILGRQARQFLRRNTRKTLLRLPGLVLGALIGLAATLLNVLSRALSWLVRQISGGHREGSHWLPVGGGLTAGVYLLTAIPWGPWLTLGFGVGYLSHLAGDACTKSGIPLVPRTAARLHLLPRPLRVRTGSGSETVATCLYSVLLVGALYLQLRGGMRLL